MSEIAKAAGLALSTVSEILKGKPGYNEETRQHVLEIAQKLNYRPNPISRALSGGRSMSIGLFATGQVTIFTVARRVQAVMEAAHRAGYRLYINHAVAPSAEAEAEGIAFLQDMMMRRVDGIIFDGHIQGEKMAQAIRKLPIPFVSIDGDWGVGGCVAIDRAKGIGEAARHLAALGHRRVGIVSAVHPGRRPTYKLAIYQEALSAAGLQADEQSRWLIPQGEGYVEAVDQAIRAAAKRGDLPTALLMNNDDAALVAIAALRANDYRVPERVSVIGFDDLPLMEYIAPPLTTISFPCAEIGAEAFRIMKRIIDAKGNDALPQSELRASFGTRLTIRGSTGPAPVA